MAPVALSTVKLEGGQLQSECLICRGSFADRGIRTQDDMSFLPFRVRYVVAHEQEEGRVSEVERVRRQGIARLEIAPEAFPVHEDSYYRLYRHDLAAQPKSVVLGNQQDNACHIQCYNRWAAQEIAAERPPRCPHCNDPVDSLDGMRYPMIANEPPQPELPEPERRWEEYMQRVRNVDRSRLRFQQQFGVPEIVLNMRHVSLEELQALLPRLSPREQGLALIEAVTWQRLDIVGALVEGEQIPFKFLEIAVFVRRRAFGIGMGLGIIPFLARNNPECMRRIHEFIDYLHPRDVRKQRIYNQALLDLPPMVLGDGGLGSLMTWIQKEPEHVILGRIRDYLNRDRILFTDDDRGCAVLEAASFGRFAIVKMLLENGPIPDRLRERAVAAAGEEEDIVRLLNGEQDVVPIQRLEFWEVLAADDELSLARWKEALTNDLYDAIADLPNEIAANPQMADQLEEQLLEAVRLQVAPALHPQVVNDWTVLEQLAGPTRELIHNGTTTPARLRRHLQERPMGQLTRHSILLQAIQWNRRDLIEVILAEWPAGAPRDFRDLIRTAEELGHQDIVELLRNPLGVQERRPSLCERITRLVPVGVTAMIVGLVSRFAI